MPINPDPNNYPMPAYPLEQPYVPPMPAGQDPPEMSIEDILALETADLPDYIPQSMVDEQNGNMAVEAAENIMQQGGQASPLQQAEAVVDVSLDELFEAATDEGTPQLEHPERLSTAEKMRAVLLAGAAAISLTQMLPEAFDQASAPVQQPASSQAVVDNDHDRQKNSLENMTLPMRNTAEDLSELAFPEAKKQQMRSYKTAHVRNPRIGFHQ
jgi:hypothetical protein